MGGDLFPQPVWSRRLELGTVRTRSCHRAILTADLEWATFCGFSTFPHNVHSCTYEEEEGNHGGGGESRTAVPPKVEKLRTRAWVSSLSALTQSNHTGRFSRPAADLVGSQPRDVMRVMMDWQQQQQEREGPIRRTEVGGGPLHAATCPPSTCVFIRGRRAWGEGGRGRCVLLWFIAGTCICRIH